MRPGWDRFWGGVWSQMGWTAALVILALLAFFATGTYRVVWDAYIFFHDDLPKFRVQMLAFDGMQRSLARIETQLNSVSGIATCIDCCPGDRSRWMQVNRRGVASRFRDGQRVRVTRQTSPYTSLIVTVDGDFEPTSGEMVQLNALACGQMRQAVDETEFRVMIEPAIEE